MRKLNLIGVLLSLSIVMTLFTGCNSKATQSKTDDNEGVMVRDNPNVNAKPTTSSCGAGKCAAGKCGGGM